MKGVYDKMHSMRIKGPKVGFSNILGIQHLGIGAKTAVMG